MKGQKGKNNKSKSNSKKISELDHKVEELIKEFNTLFYDFTANDKLRQLNNDIENIEFDITHIQLKVTKSDIEKLEILRKEKTKFEQIENSRQNRRDQISREINNLKETRIRLLVDDKSLNEIKKRVHSRYGSDRQSLEKSSTDVNLSKVVSNIELCIKKKNKLRPKLFIKNIALCIEQQYELFLGLGKKEERYYSVYKKDYFNIISPRIGIVNEKDLTSKQLYNAASK